MIKVLPRNIIRFLILVIIQVFVFNNIQLNGYINPYIYVIFIVLLPFETPGWIVLISGFLLGLAIDLFTHTLGMHAFATVFMAFCRPFVLNLLAPRDGYAPGTFPRLFYYGLNWFVKYTLFLVFIHHLSLFFIEMFSLKYFFNVLFRVILSSLFSTLLITISQFFVFRK